MQYKFIDIYDSQDEIALPSEAMNFNGKFLENEILGYRTLYVSGRESLAPELEFFDRTRRHGKEVNGRQIHRKSVTVGYQLMSPIAFVSAWLIIRWLRF